MNPDARGWWLRPGNEHARCGALCKAAWKGGPARCKNMVSRGGLCGLHLRVSSRCDLDVSRPVAALLGEIKRAIETAASVAHDRNQERAGELRLWLIRAASLCDLGLERRKPLTNAQRRRLLWELGVSQ